MIIKVVDMRQATIINVMIIKIIITMSLFLNEK
jgi:hypothetical protein